MARYNSVVNLYSFALLTGPASSAFELLNLL